MVKTLHMYFQKQWQVYKVKQFKLIQLCEGSQNQTRQKFCQNKTE